MLTFGVSHADLRDGPHGLHRPGENVFELNYQVLADGAAGPPVHRESWRWRRRGCVGRRSAGNDDVVAGRIALRRRVPDVPGDRTRRDAIVRRCRDVTRSRRGSVTVEYFQATTTPPEDGRGGSDGVTMGAADDRRRRYDANKLHKRLRREVGRAIADFGMIEDGDRVMVCLSGGKDSYTLLDILRNLQRTAPVRFELVRGATWTRNSPAIPRACCREYLKRRGVEYHILRAKTPSAWSRRRPRKARPPVRLCSRLRRGILYACAERASAPPGSPWAITATTSSRRCS